MQYVAMRVICRICVIILDTGIVQAINEANGHKFFLQDFFRHITRTIADVRDNSKDSSGYLFR